MTASSTGFPYATPDESQGSVAQEPAGGADGNLIMERDASTSTPAGAPSSDGGAAVRARLDRLLDNPLTGFAPWVVLYVVEGPGRLTLACTIALVMSVIGLALEKLRGTQLKPLAFVDVAAFSAFLLGSFIAAPSTISWFEDWFSEFGNLFLVVVIGGSMLARQPFTLPYAKEEVDREYWDSPVFLRANYVLTGVWALAFLTGALASLVGNLVLSYEDDIWTGWLIQIVAVMVAVAFTTWYAPHTMAVSFEAAGLPTDPPEPIWTFWTNVATYLIPIGAMSLLFNGGPPILGITLILLGTALRALCHRRARSVQAARQDPATHPSPGARNAFAARR